MKDDKIEPIEIHVCNDWHNVHADDSIDFSVITRSHGQGEYVMPKHEIPSRRTNSPTLMYGSREYEVKDPFFIDDESLNNGCKGR